MTDSKSAAGAAGEGNDGDGSELTPEQIAKLAEDKKLADEAKKYRLKLRDAEKTLKEREEELERLKQESENGTATGNAANAELATVKREMEALRKENKERKEREAALEEKTRKKTISSALSNIVGKLQDPASAVRLLESNAKVAADDTVVFVVKDPETGEMIEKEANLDVIKSHKLLPEIYFPAEGAAGSGGRGGKTIVSNGGKGAGGVDLQRALTDYPYYVANRDAILAARRAQRAAR